MFSLRRLVLQSRRQLPRWYSSSQSEFESAQARLLTLPEDPGNEAKLRIYALYKQATVGPVQIERPGVLDMVGRAKWDAWNELGGMSQEEAQTEYSRFINSLAPADSSQAQGDSGLDVSVKDGLRIIRLNRPKRKNAIHKEMYIGLTDSLKEAADDKNTVVTAITGTGDYFCSGNDLVMFAGVPSGKQEKQEHSNRAGDLLEDFVGAFIDFPKPLVGVVNGHALGIGFTILGLFDAVYATERATFKLPFTQFGFTPEGCSSIMFPRIMGAARANEMLMFNKTITATEAANLGLISRVYPDSSFSSEVWPMVEKYAQLPPQTLVYAKAIERDRIRSELHAVKRVECDRLRERWVSDECEQAVSKFFTRKK